jgi:hypothetical protein
MCSAFIIVCVSVVVNAKILIFSDFADVRDLDFFKRQKTRQRHFEDEKVLFGEVTQTQ